MLIFSTGVCFVKNLFLTMMVLRHTVCASVSFDSKYGRKQYGFCISITGKDLIGIYFVNTAQR